ncbi:MAG: hypothetical protein CM15mP126_2550 [Gammaproteobacteria bacterium]|nr:MAG: hypothetical protein CM15mP126_2550 [Gammaproteobacteria bacterium]
MARFYTNNLELFKKILNCMSKIIKCSDLKLKIYIEDTDFQGVVYHSNYLKYFERARSEFLSTNNIPKLN